MIFFGTKGKVIVGEQVPGVTCPDCNNGQFTSFGILRYFHVYWIPTFLTSRKVGMECAHCKRTLVGEEVPRHIDEQIGPGIFTIGRVLPMFSGLIIVGILTLGLMYSVQQDNAREAAYFAQPAVDDYYVVDFAKIFTDIDPEHHYGVMRITNVTDSGIEMQVSNIVYNLASGVKDDIRSGKATADSYYDPEPISFGIAEMQHYKDAGAVYSIERR